MSTRRGDASSLGTLLRTARLTKRTGPRLRKDSRLETVLLLTRLCVPVQLLCANAKFLWQARFEQTRAFHPMNDHCQSLSGTNYAAQFLP